MRDDELRVVRPLQFIHAFGHDLQRVDVETGIRFIQDGQLRFEHGHLKNLVAFLLTAGEAVIDGAFQAVFRQMEDFHFLLNQLDELHGIEFGQAFVLAHFVERRFQEIGRVDARDLDRVLERQEDAFAGALIGVQVE